MSETKLDAPTGSDAWYGVPLSRRHMGLIEMLVRFHAAESRNDITKEDARRLLVWLKRNSVPSSERMACDNLKQIPEPGIPGTDIPNI